MALNTPPCQLPSQNEIKTLCHATKCDILIIMCSSNISYPLTFPKTWGKEPKQLKTQKNDHFS